jgi:hypothetical protein
MQPMPGGAACDQLKWSKPYLAGPLQNAARMQVHFGNTYYILRGVVAELNDPLEPPVLVNTIPSRKWGTFCEHSRAPHSSLEILMLRSVTYPDVPIPAFVHAVGTNRVGPKAVGLLLGLRMEEAGVR